MKKKCGKSSFIKLALTSIGGLLLGGMALSSTPVGADTSFNDQGFICRIRDQHPNEAVLVAVNRNIRFDPQDPNHFANRFVIPESVFFNGKHYPITEIENRTSQNSLFSDPEAVTEVVVPASVKKIGNNAFYGMPNLKGVNFQFNSKLEEIGADAFANCNRLEKAYLPNSVKKLGDSAFENTGVESVRLSEKLEEVGKRTFFNSRNLTDLDIPKGVKVIGTKMFSDSRELKDVNLPDTLQSIGREAFAGTGILEARIPDSVTTLGEFIFYSSALQSIEFPQGLKIIPKGICCNTKLSEIILPEGIKKIGSRAFSVSSLLKTVILPSTVEVIGKEAFTDCENLGEIVIPPGVKKLGSSSFSCCPLNKIILPNSLKKVGAHAFYGCRFLRSVVVEEGAGHQHTSFETNVFDECVNLTSFISHKPVSFANPINLADGAPVFQDQNCPKLLKTGFSVAGV